MFPLPSPRPPTPPIGIFNPAAARGTTPTSAIPRRMVEAPLAHLEPLSSGRSSSRAPTDDERGQGSDTGSHIIAFDEDSMMQDSGTELTDNDVTPRASPAHEQPPDSDVIMEDASEPIPSSSHLQPSTTDQPPTSHRLSRNLSRASTSQRLHIPGRVAAPFHVAPDSIPTEEDTL